MRRLALVLCALLPASLAGQQLAGTWRLEAPSTFQGQPSVLQATITFTAAAAYEAQLRNVPAEGPGFYLWTAGRWWTRADSLCVAPGLRGPGRCLPYQVAPGGLTWGPFTFAPAAPADSLEGTP